VAASLLSVTFEDANGGQSTFSMNIVGTLPATDGELIALVQEWKDCSQARVIKAVLQQEVPIGTLSGNTAASGGSYDNVRDQAVMQYRREDATGFIRTTVPAPKDSLFLSSGPTAQADVDPASAEVVAFLDAALNAPIAGEILRSPQETQVDFQKGWRKGQKHT
jgi:hypothetical protein